LFSIVKKAAVHKVPHSRLHVHLAAYVQVAKWC